MKRYLVFLGTYYYSLGGMNDFAKDFDNYNNAFKYLKRKIIKEPYGWGHIYDKRKQEFKFVKWRDM